MVMKAKVDVEQVDTSLELSTTQKRLQKLVQGFQKGYYENLSLASDIKEDLREVRSTFQSAKESETLEEEKMSECIEIVNFALNEHKLDENQADTLVSRFAEIKEEVETKTSLSMGEKDFQFRRSQEESLADKMAANLRKNQKKSKEEIVEDFLVNQDNGHYVTQMFQILWSRWGKGFSLSNVQRLVENLEKKGIAETEGGWGSGQKEKLCYPAVTSEELKKLRDGHEQLFKGEATDDISNAFEVMRGPTDIRVHEFSAEGAGDLFLIARKGLPMNEYMTSIGLYKQGSLQRVMSERFGYKMREGNSSLGNRDAQIAWLVRRDQERIYVDETKRRARSLAGASPS
jgi:hypothetical protein